MKTELLAPAGSFSCFKQALYNGADAIYLACERFGARAYAKNLTLDELDEALTLAHMIDKKIYVTVNTIIKENELEDAKKFIYELYKLGVDGIIVTDYALVKYIINNLSPMEAHISTQSGIKSLEDVKFFEDIKANRCVLARENSFEEIKYIKENSNMPLEVFAYGALCVSYSGGCLFSSLLTLRSGNRGRCSQNCRREYQIYKNDSLFKDKGYYLSMRDLNTSSNFSKFKDIGVDSLKIEGRMKSEEYVKTVTSELRKKLDDNKYNPTLDTVFHRNYTKSFVFNEDKSLIVDEKLKSNEGALIGKIISKDKNLTKIKLYKPLNIKDRIRIKANDDYYFTIDKIYNENKKEVNSASNICYLEIFKDQPINSTIYKMVDSSIDLNIPDNFKKKIVIKAYGNVGTKLKLETLIDGKKYTAESLDLLNESINKPITKESLFKQLNKLNDTSYVLDDIDFKMGYNTFLPMGAINETRRNLISNIIKDVHGYRDDVAIKQNDSFIDTSYSSDIEIVAKCRTIEQYNALKELGINKIYFDNYIKYVDPEYKEINEDYILAGNYGALYYYKNKDITCDYSFNAINSEAIYNLVNDGAKYVCLSLEADYNLIKDIATSYKKKYDTIAPLEMVVYGHQNLMTTKYCPLKKFGECGSCNKNTYYLKDDFAKFYLYHDKCITHIINEKPLCLVEEIDKITPYVKKIRLDFTIEDYNETIRITNRFINKLNGVDEKFDSKLETRGYFKREIL